MTYGLMVFLALVAHGGIQGVERPCHLLKKSLGEDFPKIEDPQTLVHLQYSLNHYHFHHGIEGQLRKSSLSREDLLNAIATGIHTPEHDQRVSQNWRYILRGLDIKGTKQVYISLGFSPPRNIVTIFFFKEFPYTSFDPIGNIWNHMPNKFYNIAPWPHQWVKEGRVQWDIQKLKARRRRTSFEREEIIMALSRGVTHRGREDYYHGGDWFYSLAGQLADGRRVRILANLVRHRETDQRNLLIRSVGPEKETLSPPRGAYVFGDKEDPYLRPLELAQDFIRVQGLHHDSFTEHALKRMAQRGISRKDIKETILHGFYDPYKTNWYQEGGSGGAWHYSFMNRARNRPSEVVVSFDGSGLRIITAIMR